MNMMKKTFLLSFMLTVVLAAQAQLKVAPKMQEGDKKTYVTTSVTNIPGQGSVTITSESSMNVVEAKADGYLVKLQDTKVTSDAKDNNIAGKILTATQQMMEGIDLLIVTNKDGKPLSISNYADVSKKIDTNCEVLIGKMLETIPQLGQTLSKDALKQQITQSVSEENILKSLQWGVNPLALNGKTIMTGAQEEYVNDQGIKMKRMYFVNGQNVTVSASSNMTKEELKEQIIKQVEATMPEQAEMVKQNIDTLINSGMLKIEIKDTATYEFADDGWVKSIKDENTTESAGQKIVINTTVSQK